MAKGYVLVDIPSGCHECKIMFGDEYSFWCPVSQKDNINCEVYRFCESKTKPDWCPIKELPEFETKLGTYQEDWLYVEGYSACLNNILGDEINEFD